MFNFLFIVYDALKYIFWLIYFIDFINFNLFVPYLEKQLVYSYIHTPSKNIIEVSPETSI